MQYKCNCGRIFKTGTGLSTHQRFHCKVMQQEQETADVCPDGCDWAILTADVPGADEFIGVINPDTGKKYRKYCTKCGEVV